MQKNLMYRRDELTEAVGAALGDDDGIVEVVGCELG
jgi:hypothetical protein